MAGVTYKCPNCGAYLTFDPETQQWKCPFCSSAFPESELKGKADPGAVNALLKSRLETGGSEGG